MFLQFFGGFFVVSWKHKLRFSGVLFVFDFWRRECPSQKLRHQTLAPTPILSHSFQHVARCGRTWNLSHELCTCSCTVCWHSVGRLMVGEVTSSKHCIRYISSSSEGRDRFTIPEKQVSDWLNKHLLNEWRKWKRKDRMMERSNCSINEQMHK